jgi:iron complex transport system ATP-binding protein
MSETRLTGGGALLCFEDVDVTLRSRHLLAELSLTVAAGRFVALVGPNGAGKTTLLRTALGLVRPTRGRVTLDASSVTTLSPRERAARLAYLPQHPRLSEPLSAEEVVTAARFRFQESHGRALGHARKALDRAGARGLATRILPELSGGERQRVALAALLAQEAPLLLLDEPANHLDPAQQIEAYNLIGELWREGRGIVCVTHDVNLLSFVGSPERVRVVGIADGRLRFDLSYDALELPGALSKLFGIEISAVAVDGRRLFAPLRPRQQPPRDSEQASETAV